MHQGWSAVGSSTISPVRNKGVTEFLLRKDNQWVKQIKLGLLCFVIKTRDKK